MKDCCSDQTVLNYFFEFKLKSFSLEEIEKLLEKIITNQGYYLVELDVCVVIKNH